MKLIVINFLNIFDYFYKKQIIKALNSILGDNIEIFFDVGAHRGETIKLILKNFKVKKIYAFEPLEKNFLFLKKNTLKLTYKNNIKLFNCALAEIKEKRLMKEMEETSSSTLNSIDETSKYFKRKNFFLNFSFKKNYYKEKRVSLEKAINIMINNNITSIELLKIDTEGYELNVIKGFESQIKKIKVILFEHHYDLMIKKKYKFQDINRYLIKQGFIMKYKFKMPFRKTFEYVYLNQEF
tara:strand:- start:16 stop:732 length:717 start_codon:yes stop_codon:yes gene_type:complete